LTQKTSLVEAPSSKEKIAV